MRTFVRSSLVVVGLVLAACGGDGSGSPSTPAPLGTTSPVTTMLPTTRPAETTVPAVTTEPSTTSSTIPMVTMVLPNMQGVLNNRGEVLQTSSEYDSPMVAVVDIRTRNRREMPTEDVVWARGSGLNDAGLVAGDIAVGSATCPNDPNQRCTEAFVWDSVGGDITRLPGWWTLTGPNENGLVVVSNLGLSGPTPQFAVWDTATGGLTALEGLTPHQFPYVNDRGQVLGQVANNILLWDATSGQSEALPVPEAWFLAPVGLDNAGRVVANGTAAGWYGNPCYVWEPADRQWHQLGATDGSAPASESCTGVSVLGDNGLVAGTGASLNEVRVWSLTTGRLSSSVVFDVPGLLIRSVVDLNDAGQMIVIVADHPTGAYSTGSYLYDPTTDTWTELPLSA